MLASPMPMQNHGTMGAVGAIMSPPPGNLPPPMPTMAPGIPAFAQVAGTPDPDAGKNEADLTAEYIALRNQKGELAAKAKADLEPVERRMDEIEAKMLARLNAGGVESFKTTAGTAFKKLSTKFSINEPEQFLTWVEQWGQQQLLKRDVRQSEVAEFLAENGYVPPGIKVFSEFVVQFRK
jgi:hypothetical protein